MGHTKQGCLLLDTQPASDSLAICEPQVALPLLARSACLRKPAKTELPEVGSPLPSGNSLRLDPKLLLLKQLGPHQVGVPPAGNPTCFPQPCCHGWFEDVKPTATSSAESAKA